MSFKILNPDSVGVNLFIFANRTKFFLLSDFSKILVIEPRKISNGRGRDFRI